MSGNIQNKIFSIIFNNQMRSLNITKIRTWTNLSLASARMPKFLYNFSILSVLMAKLMRNVLQSTTQYTYTENAIENPRESKIFCRTPKPKPAELTTTTKMAAQGKKFPFCENSWALAPPIRKWQTKYGLNLLNAANSKFIN